MKNQTQRKTADFYMHLDFTKSQMSCSHAEFIQQLFKDQYRSCRAEDDEGLTAEEAEDRAGQSRAQKAFHHTLEVKKMKGHADRKL